ncbi:ABC transporter substrate-binding protein [bacterium]|nr:MAG: ABC transporter substrate-binding protein [bacterium]
MSTRWSRPSPSRNSKAPPGVAWAATRHARGSARITAYCLISSPASAGRGFLLSWEDFVRNITRVLIATAALGGTLAAATGAGLAASHPDLKWTAIFDATGPAGAYGTSQKNATELAQADIDAGKIDAGGQKISIDVQDSATSPAQVINIMQSAFGNGTSLIIGPTLSSEAFKSDPLAVKANVPVLGVSNTASGIPAMGPCVFRNSLSEAQIVPDVIEAAKKAWHVKTAAIIYGDDDQFTKADYTIFNAVLPKSGVKVVDVETFHKGDVDFKAQLTKIKEAKPDVVVYGALYAEGAKLLAQARQVGLNAHEIGGNGFNSPQIIALAGKAAQNVIVGAAWYSGAETNGNAAFVKNYTAKYAKSPDQFAAQAYAGVQIAAAAVKKSHPGDAAGMCSALKELGTVQTVIGSFKFASTRDADAHGFVVQIKNGTFAKFED